MDIEFSQGPSQNEFSNSSSKTITFKPRGIVPEYYEYRINPDDPTAMSNGWIRIEGGSAEKSIELNDLFEGECLFQIRGGTGSDKFGITSLKWTVDLTSPTVAVVSGPATIDGAAANFTFTSGDNPGGSGIENTECRTDGGSWGLCLSPVVLTALSHGEHTFELRSRDRAGNVSSVPQQTWTVDILPPEIAITSPSAVRGGTNGSVSWKLTEENIEAGAEFIVEFFDGSAWSEAGRVAANAGDNNEQTYTLSGIAMPSADITTARYRISVTDEAGNETRQLSKVFAVEMTSPVLRVLDLVLAEGAPVVFVPDINVALTVFSQVAPIKEIMLSESTLFTGASWVNYTGAKSSFRLSALAGDKTVYVKVRSTTGLESNVVSAIVNYQPEAPPELSWTGPAEGNTLAPSSTHSLSWNCSSSGVLPALPVGELSYSVDDGLTYHVIGTNLPNAPYSWTVPVTTPSGVAVTTSLPLKFKVSCSSQSGAISQTTSGLYNSPWKILVGGSALSENVNVAKADLDRSFFYGDSNNNFYYIKSGALMKIDRQTASVKRVYGSLSEEKCAAGFLDGALLLGIDANDVAYVASGKSVSCSALLRIRLSDGQLLSIRTLPERKYTSGIEYERLVLERYYIYYDNFVFYSLDLSNPASTPQKIVGVAGTCSSVAPAVETAGADLPIPCSSLNQMGMIISADLSKIWLIPRAGTGTGPSMSLRGSMEGGYRLKESGNPNLPLQASQCQPNTSSSDTALLVCYGSSETGNQAMVFNTDTETYKTNVVPVERGNTSIRLFVGSARSSMLVFSSTNQLFELKYKEWSGPDEAWTYTVVADNPLTTIGNNTDGSPADLRKVLFSEISDLLYRNNTLYVRALSHLRRIEFDGSGVATTISTGYNNVTIANSMATAGIAVNGAGTILTVAGVSGDTRYINALNLGSYDPLAGTIAAATTPVRYLRTNSGAASFPTYNSSFGAGANVLVSNYRYLMDFGGDENLYFTGTENSGSQRNLMLFRSNGTTVTFIAGVMGDPQSAPAATELAPATLQSSPLKDVVGLQKASDGNLWVVDDMKLKKFKILDATPTYFDVVDYASLAGYPAAVTLWTHSRYDESTGWMYFVSAASESPTGTVQVWAAHATLGWRQISTAGLNMPARSALVSGVNMGLTHVRLEVSPLGLMMLDRVNRRVLLHALF
ncbi:hypothetical protein [Bdellovibrio bacteriovorus]|nr:hypothetical protein [Bdellovibrio bacteriovorus]